MKYFGTDGIRQKADEFTSDFLAKIIKGLSNYAGNEIKVLLGGDTRESSEWILSDLETACETFGIEYGNVGVLPTPAINYCFYEMDFDFAIDVTASHNPYTDNGIKIFERGKNHGQKLSQKGCEIIEKALESDLNYTPVSPTLREDLHQEALDLYKKHLKDYIGDIDFSNLKIGLDCANGATSVISDSILKELGAEVSLIYSDSHYGTKINHDCGSTHLESLQKLVKDERLDFGIAYDGDGDRCLMIDEKGNIVDGDQIIAILANFLSLKKITVTVMANQGLLNWAKENHIKTEITPVGDSNVAAAMQENQIQLGGEQSGHIILPNEPTGDGILTSLMITRVITNTKKSLESLTKIFTVSPQIIVNIPATPAQKQTLKTSDQIKKLLLDYQNKLDAISGRLLVRPSGTENLIRITMWGENEQEIASLIESLKSELASAL